MNHRIILNICACLLCAQLMWTSQSGAEVIQFGDAIRLSTVDGTISDDQASRALEYAKRRYSRGEFDRESLSKLSRNYDGKHRPEILFLIAKEEFMSAKKSFRSEDTLRDSVETFLQVYEEYPSSGAALQLEDTLDKALEKLVTDPKFHLVNYTSFKNLDAALRFGALYSVLAKKTNAHLEKYLDTPAEYYAEPFEFKNDDTRITAVWSTGMDDIPYEYVFVLVAESYIACVFTPVLEYYRLALPKNHTISEKPSLSWVGRHCRNCRMRSNVDSSIFGYNDRTLSIAGESTSDFKMGSAIYEGSRKNTTVDLRVRIPSHDIDVTGTWSLAGVAWRGLQCHATHCVADYLRMPTPKFETFNLRQLIRQKHGSIYDWTKIKKADGML